MRLLFLSKSILNYLCSFRGRIGIQKNAVLVTPGVVSSLPSRVISVANQIKDERTRMIVVSISETPNTNLLNDIASSPPGKYTFYGTQYVELMKMEGPLQNLLCGESW